MNRALQNKDKIIKLFQNNSFSSSELERYIDSKLPNEIISSLLFLVNVIVKEDSYIKYKDNILNMLIYVKSLLELHQDINKKAISKKTRKIVESMNTYILESKFSLYPKSSYVSLFDDLTPYLYELTSDKSKNNSDNLILFNLIHKVKNIEYINISLDVLNITNEPLPNGDSLLGNLLNTYIEKIDKIDNNIDDIRYYDSVIKMLCSHKKFRFDFKDKRYWLSYLYGIKNSLKRHKKLTKEKNKYISSLIEYFENTLNTKNRLIELADRHFIALDLQNNYNVLDIDPYKSSRILNNDYIISIDHKNTGEIDDCLSCSKLDNGNYLLGIHITDLFGILNIDSNIIADAYKRVSTIYGEDLFIPMLPMNLAIDKVSLVENKWRYADSHYYEITKNGEIVSDRIMPTIITNNRKLSYDDVNKIIKEGKCKNEELLSTIQNLQEIKQILIGKFHTDFTSISHQQDTFDHSYNGSGNGEAEQIVLYTMLFENSNMAEYFHKNHYPLIYRVHSFNHDHELERKNILNSLNMDNSQSTIRLADMIIKNRPQSTYALCGSHEGLGIKHYCHSTSPERRFADLWNRYLIKQCLMNRHKDKDIYSLEHDTKEIINHINEQLCHIDSFIADYKTLNFK